MREFIMRARKAKTNPGLNLNELPKEGKMDSVCAAVSAAIFLSDGIRKDTIFHAVLEGPSNGPKVITFDGGEMRGFHHDERSIAAHIANALQRGAFLKLNEQLRVRPGLRVAKKSFEKLVSEKKGRQLIVLDSSGTDVRAIKFSNPVIIFGSAEGLPPKSEAFLARLNAEKVSLGPKTIFASHCPVIVHNEMDRKSR